LPRCCNSRRPDARAGLGGAIERCATPASRARAARAALSAPAFRRAAPARHDRHGAGGPARLLLADEPTTALDVTLRAQILDLLATSSSATAWPMLLITHDLNLVRKFADRVAVMENGTWWSRARWRVFRNPQHPTPAS
jgi:microcin C transport system ATP-binding protein